MLRAFTFDLLRCRYVVHPTYAFECTLVWVHLTPFLSLLLALLVSIDRAQVREQRHLCQHTMRSTLPPLAVLPSLPCTRQAETTTQTSGLTRVRASVHASDPLSAILTVSLGTDAISSHFASSASNQIVLACSLKQLRRLRAGVQDCVGRKGKHCKQCTLVAQYLRMCWETPRLVVSSWADGKACLRMSVLAHFFNTLLGLADSVITQECECVEHTRLLNVIMGFLQPSDSKDV